MSAWKGAQVKDRNICGFKQWWSNDLKKDILNDDGTMKADTPLVGDEWNTPKGRAAGTILTVP